MMTKMITSPEEWEEEEGEEPEQGGQSEEEEVEESVEERWPEESRLYDPPYDDLESPEDKALTCAPDHQCPRPSSGPREERSSRRPGAGADPEIPIDGPPGFDLPRVHPQTFLEHEVRSDLKMVLQPHKWSGTTKASVGRTSQDTNQRHPRLSEKQAGGGNRCSILFCL
jgi:hypothetical protein